MSTAIPVQPVQAVYIQAVPPPSTVGRIFTWLMRTFFVLSILFNILLFNAVAQQAGAVSGLGEKFHSGDPMAVDAKVAIVRVDGLIAEGMTGFAHQQLRAAARDDHVKAVVLAINSPGGSVTASDQLFQAVRDLQEGKWDGQAAPKPVVAAMESVAASGGYYIAAPARTIFAQPTTITGSIGVYAAFFDASKLADKLGLESKLLKRGELKGGGSIFKPMTPEEEREFDEMIENVYRRFQAVVKEGRGDRLKFGLRDEIKVPTLDGKTTYVRRLADGGAFSADQALAYGLIDQIGYMPAAIAEAKKLASLPDARVITYTPPFSFMNAFLGLEARQTPPGVRLDLLPGVASRLWFLAPGYELAAVAGTVDLK